MCIIDPDTKFIAKEDIFVWKMVRWYRGEPYSDVPPRNRTWQGNKWISSGINTKYKEGKMHVSKSGPGFFCNTESAGQAYENCIFGMIPKGAVCYHAFTDKTVIAASHFYFIGVV